MSYEWTFPVSTLKKSFHRTQAKIFQEVDILSIIAEFIYVKANITECSLKIILPNREIMLQFKITLKCNNKPLIRTYNYGNDVEANTYRTKKMIDLSLIRTSNVTIVFTPDPTNVARLIKTDKDFENVYLCVKHIRKFDDSKLNNTVHELELANKALSLENRELTSIITNIVKETPPALCKVLEAKLSLDKLSSMDYNDIVHCENILVKCLASITDELQEKRSCQICLQRIRDVIFIPCNHVACCTTCGNTLLRCPLCTTKITKIQRIYL